MLEQKMQEYIDLLKEVDTKDVEPLTHVMEYTNVFREDVVTNQPVEERTFVVPKTIG